MILFLTYDSLSYIMDDKLSYQEVMRLPSTTFFNLPTEKREKFLHAARGEYARVPYTDVSINRIIRDAGIPRGSFYMYFKDKRELLVYLLGEYGGRLSGLMEAALLKERGDLFAAFLAFYDDIRKEYENPVRDHDFEFLIAILRRNSFLHAQVFQTAADPETLLGRLIPHIDRSLLFLRSETDLKDMFTILMAITGPALCGALQGPDPAASRAQYINLLNILRRGMAIPVTSSR